MPVIGFDYIEFFVSNAKQACYFWERGMGFEVVGYRGLETGERDVTSYALQQNNVKVVLTAALNSRHFVAEQVRKHGDGVHSIGFQVQDAKACYDQVIARGAASVSEPRVVNDNYGKYVSASVQIYGDTIHTFVERDNYKGCFAPQFKPLNNWTGGTGLTFVDHVVGNVGAGEMMSWVDYYEKVFGFHVYQGFDPNDISTQYSALASRVMANKSASIKMPINEPASGQKQSQIQEYLDYYEAAGVQHMAVATNDIISTVSMLQKRGIEFLNVPKAYYKELRDRVGAIDEDMETLANLGILVDRESKGYLLQIFTKPIEDRPTFFIEVIQRVNGATGFGKGNFMSLFESIEREQELRGNL